MIDAKKRMNEVLKEKVNYPEIDYYNPYHSFRKGQREAIEKVLTAFESGKRFVILELPTGSGKSVLAYIVSKIIGSTYFITSSKMLQDQYARDFPDLAITKGRSNFQCLMKHSSCADGWCRNNKEIQPIDQICIEKPPLFCISCKKTCANMSVPVEECPHKPKLIFDENEELVKHFTNDNEDYCPYWKQKIKGISNYGTVMNNWYYLPELNFINQFKARDLLVIDEAHNASEILVDNVGLKFELDKVEQIISQRGIVTDFEGIRNNVVRWYKKFKFLSDLLVDYISENEIHIGEKELKFLKDTISKCYNVMNWLKEDKSLQQWVIQLEESTLTVTPLNASRFAEDYLFKHADKVLLMSATLNYEMTLKELGINPDEAEFISMPSNFPKKNCKIYSRYVGKLTGNPENYLNYEFINKIENICLKHEGEKGIIHCVSYNIMDYILENLDRRRHRLFAHNQRVPDKNKKWYRVNNKNEILNNFIQSENGILVSPSSYEGLDLADKDVKFQIHCKIPYLSLGDDRIKKKAKQDSKWYSYRAGLILTQAIGRGVRSKEDTCFNYILDMSFEKLLKMGVISPYIKDRII